MSRNIDRQESLRIAAEKMRLQKEKEIREDREFYERVTSGWQWLMFKIVVVFCTLMLFITTFDYFVDGPTKKLTDKSWKIDRNWEYHLHKVLDVEGYMFTPVIGDWSDRVENTLTLTYSPIFRTGKTLTFITKDSRTGTRKIEEIRQRSAFNWFPALQIFLLIPLLTLIFKRQSAAFNFARIASLVFVFPGTLIVIFFTMM